MRQVVSENVWQAMATTHFWLASPRKKCVAVAMRPRKKCVAVAKRRPKKCVAVARRPPKKCARGGSRGGSSQLVAAVVGSSICRRKQSNKPTQAKKSRKKEMWMESQKTRVSAGRVGTR